MTSLEEKEAVKAEAKAEAMRRLVAAFAAAVCAITAAFMLLVMVRYPGQHSASVLRTLVALVLSVALVLGARALDGPIRMREHRRGHDAASAAAAALALWLGCFGAIMAAFVVSDLVARLDGFRAEGGSSRTRSVAVKDGDRRGVVQVVVTDGSGTPAEEKGGGASSGGTGVSAARTNSATQGR